MYTDTHCHLSKDDYDDIDEIIKKAIDQGVKRLFISGCDKKGIIESVEISKKYENVYLELGFHPSEAEIVSENDIEWLKKIIEKNKKVIAIGEIGLDYHWVKDNKEKQQKLFKNMILIAKELNLPVVIHSRDAFQDTYDILKQMNVTGVIHCFSGNIENAKMYTSLGFKLGIGGVSTFKNTKLKEVIKEIQISNILLETDSPYLTPEPYRGRKNEPSYIPVIAENISKLKEIPLNNLAEIIEKNVNETFKFD